VAWGDWAAGVLTSIGAPVDSSNVDTLWAWSVAESGADAMRWNNPLNTTYYLPGSVNQNSVGVKSYPTETDGVTATVATLTNGYYPVIVDHLSRSIPRQQWSDACRNLGTWGTGCGWIDSAYYGPAAGVLEAVFMALTDQQQLNLYNTVMQVYYLLTTGLDGYPGGGAGTRQIVTKAESDAILAAIRTVPTGGVDTNAILAAIADLRAHPAFDPDDAAILNIVQRMEAALKSA
jgi:hypothetical protein